VTDLKIGSLVPQNAWPGQFSVVMDCLVSGSLSYWKNGVSRVLQFNGIAVYYTYDQSGALTLGFPHFEELINFRWPD
jgi:hypothetical protein